MNGLTGARRMLPLCAVGLCLTAFTASGIESATITIDFAVEKGVIKPVNGASGGPICPGSEQLRGNFLDFKAAEIPYVRNHDVSLYPGFGGSHAVDITAVFPDFGRDENDPTAYDFAFTDQYLSRVRQAGSEPYYRLGQSIEHGIRKYGVWPPKDFAKWARICEHVIAHYNGGWANGFRWNIRHWEIWNEPDNNVRENPVCWGGTTAEFYDLFEITARHLKKTFPELKVGGPGTTGYGAKYDTDFVCEMARRKVPMDFFSWHGYPCHDRGGLREFAARCAMKRELLDTNGYAHVESHVTEWNYVRGWKEEWPYTLRVESGDLQEKGAAYESAMLSILQDAPVDLACYYTVQPSIMNGFFDYCTLAPMKGYYPFFSWAKLRRLGTQVRTSVRDDKGMPIRWKYHVTAAKGVGGKVAVLLTRYEEDDNAFLPEKVVLRLTGARTLADPVCHLTDRKFLYTQRPVDVASDGSLSFVIQPNSVLFIEGFLK